MGFVEFVGLFVVRLIWFGLKLLLVYIYIYLSGIRAYWDLGGNSNIKASILRKNKRPLDYRYATEWCKSRLSFRAINPYNLQPVS
jgi:hypothetical protein